MTRVEGADPHPTLEPLSANPEDPKYFSQEILAAIPTGAKPEFVVNRSRHLAPRTVPEEALGTKTFTVA